MPELPEVETIRRQLAPLVEGRRLERVEILDARWSRPLAPRNWPTRSRDGAWSGWAGGASTWCGSLEDDVHLAQHLRMTGAVLCEPDPEPPHIRVRIELRPASGALAIVDPRRFGTGELLLGERGAGGVLRRSPRAGAAGRAVHRRAPARAGARAHGPIKAFLLDQRRIAGVGNIYADEALFRAGIHPLRPAGRLSRRAVRAPARDGRSRRCRPASRRAGRRSTTSATSTACAAPSRTASSCTGARASRARDCGTTIVKMVVAGRGTYVCESCQPRPRRREHARRAEARRLQEAASRRASSSSRSRRSRRPPEPR